jgi:hypothetical protein
MPKKLKGPKRNKKGQWLKGTTGNPKGPAVTIENSDLSELIAKGANLRRLAESVLRRAYEGDSGSQAQVLRIVERAQHLVNPASAADYTVLTDGEVKLLMRLQAKTHHLPHAEVDEILAMPPHIKAHVMPVDESELDEIVERAPTFPDEDEDEDEEPPRRQPETPPTNLRPTDPNSDPDTVEYQTREQERLDAITRDKYNDTPKDGSDLTSGLRKRHGAFGLPADHWTN